MKKENKKNSWGNCYVDKYIRENEHNGCIGYVVFIHRKDLQVNQRFETIEKAREFRDNALRLCELKRLENIKVNLDIEVWPFNLIEAVEFEIEEVIDRFEEKLENCGLNDKEIFVIRQRYQEMKTLEEIGEYFDVTRERIRQVIHKTLRKIKHRHLYFELGEYRNKEEKAKQDYEKFLQEQYDKWTYESALEYIKNYELLGHHTQNNVCDLPIEDLDLSVRSYNCLKRAYITNIQQILENKYKLKRVRNLGKKSLREIKKKLEEFGVELDIEI